MDGKGGRWLDIVLIVGDSEHGCGDVTGDKRGDEKH